MEKMKDKYGTSPIQRNWNRMAELTSNWPKKDSAQDAELQYRISVQNHFALNGGMVPNYIPVGFKPWGDKELKELDKDE